MSAKTTIEFVCEGHYIAEVDVQLIESLREWSPYYSLDDAQKLDAVRLALRHGDLDRARQLARVYEAPPVRTPE
jgi:hypothetical protein